MRKQVERVERKKKLMVYFMGIVMISSVFGVIFFGFTSGSGKLKYNDFKFLNKGSYWSANVDGREARFTYFPADVEQIKVDDIIISRLKNTIEIDVTSDFNETNVEEIALAQYQMGIVLNNFDVFVRQGLSSENENNIPIILKDFRIKDVHTSNEAFVTGTFAGIIPAVEIDGLKLSSGKRGKMTLRIQELYKEKLSDLYPIKY